MVRISDARMSGTAFGTAVLHVSPESAAGGPIGLVRDGDMIRLDARAQVLEIEVDDTELRRRRAEQPAARDRPGRGYQALYLRHVMQADQGCDFDFLPGRSENPGAEPEGLLSGWVGGW
jgi:dihydroxy-acid dehydratase